jgi:peptide/nickel transport system permease protein
MPGDVVWSIVGFTASQADYDAMYKHLGLDQPFLVQYWNYISNIILHFDLGTSFMYNHDVGKELIARLPFTIILGVLSTVVTILVGMPVGIVSATKQYSAADYILTVVSMILASMPSFWLALMLMLVFSVKLRWLPATGTGTWRHWVLPVASSGLMMSAVIMRMTRSSMLEVIRQDYIRTARAKGLKKGTVIRRHALKNSLIPVVTVIGMQFSILIGGSVIVETIFNMPGIGMYLMTGINNRDYPVIMGCVLLISAWTCVVNLIVDLSYAFIDPRISAQFRRKKAKREAACLPGEGVT